MRILFISQIMTICNTRLLNIDMTTLHTFGCSITQGYALPRCSTTYLAEDKELTGTGCFKIDSFGSGTKFIYINLVDCAGPQVLAG